MRRALPVLTVAALAVALAGCTAGDPDTGSTPDSTPTASDSGKRVCATSGAGTDKVDVTGDFGSIPTVVIDEPIEVDTTERRVVIEGEGDPAVYGDTVRVDFTLYNGTTGDTATQTEYDGGNAAEFLLNEVAFIPGLVRTIECSKPGARVIGVVPASQAFGENGLADFNISAGDTVVFVVDVLEVERPLQPAAWTDGVPTVTRDGDVPVVTLPEGDAPTELLEAVLEEGDGATVVAGDTVQLHYQGTSWETGEVFDQSFGGDPAAFATNQVVQGFGAALVGQKVGSTVVVVIPPALGYGPDPQAHQLGGQTLVFLIDILGVNGN